MLGQCLVTGGAGPVGVRLRRPRKPAGGWPMSWRGGGRGHLGKGPVISPRSEGVMALSPKKKSGKGHTEARGRIQRTLRGSLPAPREFKGRHKN